MRAHVIVGALAAALLASCGLEGMFMNVGRKSHARPASAIHGTAAWTGAGGATVTLGSSQLTVTDSELTALVPFSQRGEGGGRYVSELPSSRYSMLFVQGRVGDTQVRALVPYVGPESAVYGVDLNARSMTEALIVEAALSAQGIQFSQTTPAAYVGDGVSNGTRTLIRAAFDAEAPTTAQAETQTLLHMVERLLRAGDPTSGATDPSLFLRPVYYHTAADPTYVVSVVNGQKKSALDGPWLLRSALDYTGDSVADMTSDAFDAQLGVVARLYRPEGCEDLAHKRLVFTVDFNQGGLDGNCNTVNRYKWVTDKPGKKMFFVGWLYVLDPPGATEVNDASVSAAIGAGVPNAIPMYDDGTNGDEASGDGVWTVTFDVPYDPARKLRLGYKYTWGFQGDPWTGTEEWPGNSRILEVVDDNADGFVYRRDVFQDEATNKDRSNLNTKGAGTLTWSSDVRGCGAPESHEQGFVLHDACACGGPPHTPTSVGPIRIACTQ
jgi:hypothetical protein